MMARCIIFSSVEHNGRCATLIHSPGEASILTGDKRMKQRPIRDLTDALKECG